jgi:hypothetical protein
MEVAAKVIETSQGRRTETAAEGQSYTDGYLDEPYEVYGENAGREMLDFQQNF